jgi:hypothetical protein
MPRKLFFFALAAVLRCGMLLIPPFSTDTQRFLADGLAVRSGENPYQAQPQGPVPYGHLRSFYPPLQQATFGALVAVWPSREFFRLFAGLCELAFLLWYFYRKWRKVVPVSLTLFLLFNPLSLHEVWREGHLDHIAVYFLYFAILNVRAAFAFKRNHRRGYVFTMLSIGWKFYGILAPLFRLRKWNAMPNLIRRLFSPLALTAAAFLAMQLVPVFFFTPFAERGFTVYVNYWHHGNAIVDLFRHFGFAAPHAIYLVQRLIAVLLFGLALGYAAGRLAFYDAFCIGLGSLLVLFPVQHPWYYFLLFPVVLLLPRWRTPAMLLIMLTPLTYLGYTESYKSWGFTAILTAWVVILIFHFTRRKKNLQG